MCFYTSIVLEHRSLAQGAPLFEFQMSEFVLASCFHELFHEYPFHCVLLPPHAQRERGKVIGVGVYIYIYIYILYYMFVDKKN